MRKLFFVLALMVALSELYSKSPPVLTDNMQGVKTLISTETLMTLNGNDNPAITQPTMEGLATEIVYCSAELQTDIYIGLVSNSFLMNNKTAPNKAGFLRDGQGCHILKYPMLIKSSTS